jgi:hypothetical protein
VPLLKNGVLSAILYLHDAEPRVWTAADVAIAEDVAHRTWDAIERADAERLLQSERLRLQAIVETIPTGLIMMDEQGTLLLIENDEWKKTWGGNAQLDEGVDYRRYKGFWADSSEPVAMEKWPCFTSLKEGTVVRRHSERPTGRRVDWVSDWHWSARSQSCTVARSLHQVKAQERAASSRSPFHWRPGTDCKRRNRQHCRRKCRTQACTPRGGSRLPRRSATFPAETGPFGPPYSRLGQAGCLRHLQRPRRRYPPWHRTVQGHPRSFLLELNFSKVIPKIIRFGKVMG